MSINSHLRVDTLYCKVHFFWSLDFFQLILAFSVNKNVNSLHRKSKTKVDPAEFIGELSALAVRKSIFLFQIPTPTFSSGLCSVQPAWLLPDSFTFAQHGLHKKNQHCFMSWSLVLGSPRVRGEQPTLLLLCLSAAFQPAASLLISDTHLPAPPGSHNCYGRWPAPMEASRCSSRSPVCPHTGRSYSWPGSHTRSRLQGGRRFVQNLRIIPPSSKIRLGLLVWYLFRSPATVTITHFFLL